MSLATLASRSARPCSVADRRPAAAAAAGARPAACRSRRTAVSCKAMLEPEGERKKFITREQEPDQYWSSEGEKAGSNPFKDPLAIIGIVAILFPFAFVLLAIGTGAIDISVYR